MKYYARIDSGVFVELIEPKAYDAESPDWKEGDVSRIGNEIPVEARYPEDFIKTFVDVTDVNPLPSVGWNYDAVKGFTAPVEVSPSFPSKQEIEELRLIAYAHPITGIDRHFAEVLSLQAEGFAASSTEVKEAKAKGLARKLEIQTLYPYPVE